MAIYVADARRDELQSIFDKLKDGFHNSRPQELHDMPFGTYGQFYHRYGLHWIFHATRSEPE